GKTNIPDPITMPTITAVASSIVSLRGRSRLVSAIPIIKRALHESIIGPMLRRNFITSMIAAPVIAGLGRAQQPTPFVEGPASGQPHRGKVLLAVQAHSDDIPLSSSGTVAKLIEEGYTGYLVRATNDDMGDAIGLGTPGTIGQNVLGNEHDNNEIAKIL